MSQRKLNGLEQKIHQAALSASDKKITQREVDALSTDLAARTSALNFLLGAGLLKVLKGDDGKLQYRGVVKEELDVKKGLSNEEALVLSHIQASGTEGIWTKHIKAKTELHQTVIDRCLKSLTQKQLVKALKGTVQHPTRKMYILFHLEPSTEVTGGPWYTDKELDTEFIKLLSAACLKFIRDRSFPRSKSDTRQQLLYPISAAPPYPTASQVQTFLNKSRITETQLTVEHVEMLLNVLVIDGEVEKLPALGATLWEASMADEEEESSGDEKHKGKKRKRGDDEAKRKKKRRKTHSSDEESDSEEESRHHKSKSKHKSKKRRRAESDDDESRTDSEGERQRKHDKRKKRKSRESDDEDDASDSDAHTSRHKKKSSRSSKHKKRSKSISESSSSDTESPSDSDTDSDSDSDSEPVRRHKSKSRSKSKSKKHSSSPGPAGDDYGAGALSGALVYRAIHTEHMADLGLSQAPCGKCPVFDFCRDKGPVNADECSYFGEWLGAAAVKVE